MACSIRLNAHNFCHFTCRPAAYPVSLLLNVLLGKEIGVFYQRDELKELLKQTQEYSDLEREELGKCNSYLLFQSNFNSDYFQEF